MKPAILRLVSALALVGLGTGCAPDSPPLAPSASALLEISLEEGLRASPEEPLALLDVTVLDGRGGPSVTDRGLLIQGSRILRVGSSREIEAESGSRGWSAARLPGAVVMPGLIDVHAHVAVMPVGEGGRLEHAVDEAASARMLRALLAHGVTTVRNPAAPAEGGVALRQAVAEGRVPGPRIVTAGEALQRSAPGFGPFVAVRSERQIRAEIQRQAEVGVDWIKVYAGMPPAELAIAVDEAHRLGLPVVGHLQTTTWTEGARAGIDAITHGAPWSGAYLPEELRRDYRPTFRGRVFWLENLDLDSPVVDEMVTEMARRRVFVDPTLVAYHSRFFGDEERYRSHPKLHLAPDFMVDLWRRGGFTAGWTAEDYRRAKAAWPQVLALTRHLFEAGVPLAAGSDTANPWVIPGASLHEELRHLESAGIPTSEVLRIATLGGAQALGLAEELGTVEAGKRADLLILPGDPSADLERLEGIQWVVQGGVFRSPKAILGGAAQQ